MPNNVRNILRMKGIAKLPFFTEVDGILNFDFNKIIPMPKELLVDSPAFYEVILWYLTDQGKITNSYALRKNPEVEKYIDDTKIFKLGVNIASLPENDREKKFALGKQYVENILKYSCTDWYEWRMKNWGTKWNSYDNFKNGCDEISFMTAWSYPDKIIEKLAELYPDREIEVMYAEENCGYNCGIVTCADGSIDIYNPPAESEEAYQMFEECWGYLPMDGMETL